MNFYSIDYKGVTEAMKKKVSIYPKTPITSTNPPIRVPIEKVTKEVRDIRRCIIAGAKVFEHLEEIPFGGISFFGVTIMVWITSRGETWYLNFMTGAVQVICSGRLKKHSYIPACMA